MPSEPNRTESEPVELIPGFSGEFDLKQLLRVLWAGRAWVVTMAILGCGLGFLVTYLETPIYQAQVLVRIDPPGQNISALSNPYPATAFNWFDYQNYYNTQYRIIRPIVGRLCFETLIVGRKFRERTTIEHGPEHERCPLHIAIGGD